MAKRPKTIKYDPNGYSTPSPRPPVIYGVQQNREIGNWTGCDRPPAPPKWLLDLMAEEKITGRFNTAPSNLCTGCKMFRSSNGVGCWC